MQITFDEALPGHDHEIARADGEFFGFRGLKSGTIGVQKCAKCRKENYALAVLDGRCCWCGWSPHDESN